MSAATSTVFMARAERTPGTVHLVVTTDLGDARLRFTPALAKLIGRELVQQADQRDVSAPANPAAPVLKPCGQIL